MAIHRSAAKRARQTPKRTERNRSVRSKVKTSVRDFLTNLTQATDLKACEAEYRKVVGTINRAVSSGVLPRNTGSRKISRLAIRMEAALKQKQAS